MRRWWVLGQVRGGQVLESQQGETRVMGVLVVHGDDAGADMAVDDGEVGPQASVGPGVGLRDPVRRPWFAMAHVAACHWFPGETKRD